MDEGFPLMAETVSAISACEEATKDPLVAGMMESLSNQMRRAVEQLVARRRMTSIADLTQEQDDVRVEPNQIVISG